MALVMPSARPRRRAVALSLLFALAASVQSGTSFAQPVYDDYAPGYDCGPGGYDCEPEYPMGCCEPPCNDSCFGGGWFGAEYLRWRIEGGDPLPPLVTDAPANSPSNFPGALGNSDTRILYGDQTVGEDWRDGYRVYGGVWLDCCQCYGIGVDYFDMENDGSFFISDPNSGRIVTRPFFDTQAGDDRAELVDVPNELDGTVAVASSDDFSGGGVTLQRRVWQCCDPCGCGPTSQVYMLGGYRHYRYDTDLAITENLLFTGTSFPGVIPGTTIFLEDRFSTENEFNGGEAGVQGVLQKSCWWVDGLFKVAVGSHRRVVTINGQTINTVPGGGTTEFEGGLLTSEVTNIGRYADNTIAVIPELRVGVGGQLTNNISVRAGYGILLWNAVARAGSQLPPGLEVDPRNQPPLDPNNPGGPEPEFNGIFGNPLVAHGFDFGVQFTY
jgi:hypothetical protein